MLNVHQIAKRVNGFRRSGSKFVRFTDLKKGYLTNGNGYIAGASYSTHVIDSSGKVHKNEDPSKYVTLIEFIDSELHVNISCSCSDFTYRWEWALWNRGAAQIEYSNGDSPDVRNPTYKPAGCKHFFALYEKIKSKIPAPVAVTPNKKKEVEQKSKKKK